MRGIIGLLLIAVGIGLAFAVITGINPIASVLPGVTGGNGDTSGPPAPQHKGTLSNHGTTQN